MTEQRHTALGIHAGPEQQAHDGSGAPHYPSRGPLLQRAKLTGAAMLAVLLIGAGATLVLRANHARALSVSTAEQGQLYVTTLNPKVAADNAPLTLPGTLQGIIESPIYARSSGYVLRWKKDIGSQVSQGEVLAEIDTPEVDQQLSQAIASRQQAAASLDLALSTARRWEALRQKDAVTQQELNERNSTYTQAQANLAAAEANVRRLQKLEGFKKVTAPFAGVITHRNVEVGDLINAGNGGAGRALFTLAQVDMLRVYVYVPQAYAQRIKVGDPVTITQGELIGQVFHGSVARTAGAIDAATRTMQLEINLPNPAHTLLSGAYVQVALAVSGSADALTVPSNVLLFRAEGPCVAVVGQDGRIKLHPVTIGHDLGNSMEILQGVTLLDKLVINPPDSLADNDVVTATQQAAGAKKAAQ